MSVPFSFPQSVPFGNPLWLEVAEEDARREAEAELGELEQIVI